MILSSPLSENNHHQILCLTILFPLKLWNNENCKKSLNDTMMNTSEVTTLTQEN